MIKKLFIKTNFSITKITLLSAVFILSNCSSNDYFEDMELEPLGNVKESQETIASKTTVNILNPGFESGKDNWGSESNFAISNDEYSGSKAAKVTSSSGKIEQTVSISKNTNYELKAWVNGNGKLSIGGSTNDFSTSSYQQITVSFNSGNATSATILGKRDSGDVRFDAFTLTGEEVTTSGRVNLALGRKVKQSSNYSSTKFKAEAAVDGDTGGNIRGGDDVTHTRYENNPYWQVYLDGDVNIEEIKIYNRTDCCADRLKNFDVFVYNKANNLVFKHTISGQADAVESIPTNGVVGYRVRIKLKDKNYLSLAEVEVFGDSDVTTPPPTSGGDVEDILGDFWKITLPFDKDGNASPTNCVKYSCRNNNAADLYGLNEVAANSKYNDYFYEDNGWVIFKAFAGGATTTNSQYPRAELRGLNENGDDDYFSMSDHQELEVTVKVLEVPTNRPEVNMVQIHGPKDEPLRVEFNDGSTGSNDGLHLTINENTTLKNVIDYKIKDELKVWVKVESGKMWLNLTNLTTGKTFNNNGNSYSINDSTGYWKTGCYLQSSAWYCDYKSSTSYCQNGGESDDYWATGEVAVKDLSLIRDGKRLK